MTNETEEVDRRIVWKPKNHTREKSDRNTAGSGVGSNPASPETSTQDWVERIANYEPIPRGSIKVVHESWNLSKEIGLAGEMHTGWTDTEVIPVGKVREFIRRLKEDISELDKYWGSVTQNIYAKIDKRAGDALIK